MTIRKPGEYMGLQDFVFFFGVVEDLNDPLKAGRARVRCHTWHTSNKVMLPTSELPWAQTITPVTSAAYGNLGQTPMGLQVGSTVFGFFADARNAQIPMILGSLPGISPELNEPDVNRLARNDSEFVHPVIQAKNAAIATGIPVARGGSWNEPNSAWNPEYPSNHVFQSKSGHIREYDDTPNNRRIHEYHAAGTFYEIDNTGNKVTRIVGNNYEIVAGSNFVNIKGDANITVDGALKIKASSLDIETDSYTLNVNGESLVRYGGSYSVRNEGDVHSYIGKDTYSRHESGTDYTCPDDASKVRTTDNDCSDVQLF